MGKHQTTSRSYLLRLWPTGAAGQPVWRASLENVQSGERRGFANLEQLFVFLMEQTEHGGDASAAQSTAEPGSTGRPSL